MKILIYGAGVMGSMYAARLKEAGQDVTILARGKRLEAIKEHGLILEQAITGEKTSKRVDVVETLAPEDNYDLVVVLMPKKNLPAILPSLAENHNTPNVLFMFNNAAGPDEMIQALGRDRVLLGFPGAGGIMDGHIVKYAIVSGRQQPTTFGELDGKTTLRLKKIANVFKEAGFPVAISPNMDAWLKTHVAEICPVANALYMAGGNCKHLADNRDAILLAIKAIREGHKVLTALGTPVTPSKHRIFKLIPERLLARLMKKKLKSNEAAFLLGHANSARDEMEALTRELAALAGDSEVATPSLDRQHRFHQDINSLLDASTALLILGWPGIWI